MKNLRQRLTVRLTLLGLITFVIVLSAHASNSRTGRSAARRRLPYGRLLGVVRVSDQGDDGRYHMFASRWPKDIAFRPVNPDSEDGARRSRNRPEGPGTVFQQVVLHARGGVLGRTPRVTLNHHGDTSFCLHGQHAPLR